MEIGVGGYHIAIIDLSYVVHNFEGILASILGSHCPEEIFFHPIFW